MQGEFNPFDDLGIKTTDTGRRDQQYLDINKINPFGEKKYNVDPGNQPDFGNTLNTGNNKDWEVKSNLGIDLPEPMADEDKQNYVNSLSNEDRKTRNNLKNEGYSFEARQALFDNRDLLYDINETGTNKYMQAKAGVLDKITKHIQNSSDFYEESRHPWMESARNRLDEKAQEVLEKNDWNTLYEEGLGYGYTSDQNKTLEGKRAAYATAVTTNARRELAYVEATLLQAAKLGPSLLDFYQNARTSVKGSIANRVNEKIKGEDYQPVTVDPSKRSTIRGSWITAKKDLETAAFLVKYPIASFMMESLAASNPDIENFLNNAYIKLEDKIIQLMDWAGVKDLVMSGLNEQEQQEQSESIANEFLIGIGSLLEGFGIKLSRSERVKMFETAVDYSNRLSKEYAKGETSKTIKGQQEVLQGSEPGTELLNKGGKPVAVSTEGGMKITPRGYLDLLIQKGGNRWKSFRKSFEWFYKNKDKRLVTRDPNAPVGELPKGAIPSTETIKPTEKSINGKIEEIQPEEPIKPKTTTPITPKQTGRGITTFIKDLGDKVTGKKGGLKPELYEKLKADKNLQNEYINTIDPYLKSGGASNPKGVIEGQLEDFINTAKNQLLERKQNNLDFRSGQMKYNVEIPKEQKLQRKIEDQKINNLIKVLNNKQKDSEIFLKYLLNLSKETIEGFNKYIPDFSQNLNLIKDTLDLTQAITKSDLLEEFLNFKSGRGSRRKGFLRKKMYQYLRNKYKEQGIEYRMNQIEEILNNMSEEELIAWEKEIENGEIRAMDSEAEFASLREKGYMPDTYIPANENLEQIMNSKWPGTNMTTKEYLQSKGVQLSVGTPSTVYRVTGGALAGYHGLLDRIILREYANPYKAIIFHEFGHRVLNQLGTTQMMDIITHIAKRDGITEDAAFERRAEYFRNYMQYNNIDGKKYLIKNLGKDLASQVEAVAQKTKDEIWDLFDIEEDKEIYQIISDVKHDTPAGQDITSRRPEPLTEQMVGKGQPVRYQWMQDVLDPNIESVYTDPYFDKKLMIKFKDGTSKPRTEFRETLTDEQLKQIDKYETDFLTEYVDEILGKDKGIKGEGKFNRKTLMNETDLNDLMRDTQTVTKKDLGLDAFEGIDFMNQLRDMDPDIIGLVDKNGEIYLKVMQESQRERYEQTDRPGQREIKEVKADDYLTEEEMNKLAPEIQEKLKVDKGLYQGGQGGLQYSEGKNLKLGNGYYFGSKKQAKEFGPAIIRLEQKNRKFYEPKDTQSYQVEASQNGGKEAFNKKLQEEGYDGIKAYNQAFNDYEYNFFSNPFEKNAN